MSNRKMVCIFTFLLLVSPALAFLSEDSPNVLVRLLVGFFQATTCWRWYFQDGLPGRNDYNDVYFPPEEVLQNIPANNEGPMETRGVFWLSYSTEVISFAPTNEGAGLGQPFAEDPPRRRMRLLSERNWAVTERGTGGTRFWMVSTFDFIFDFVINDGTLEAPKRMDIFVDYRIPFSCSRGQSEGCGVLYPDWSMTLQNVPGGDQAHPVYGNSVVWLRESKTVFGPGSASEYEAIQIADENGSPLYPAFTDFVSRAPEGFNMVTQELVDEPRQPLCTRPWCLFGLLC